jgi:outer membrane protein
MRILILAIVILLNIAEVFPQKTITLDNAIKIALNRNTTLQRSQNNLRTYEHDVKASYGSLLPTIGASSSYTWSKTESNAGVGGAALSFSDETFRAGVSSNLLLFNGLSNYALISQSKNDLEAAQSSFKRLKQDIIFNIIRSYYDIIYLHQRLVVAEEDVKWNQKNLETITERNRLGAVTLADVYAQQVRVGNAEVEVIRTKNNLETAKSNFLYNLGIDVSENYIFPENLTASEKELLGEKKSTEFNNIEELKQEALKYRADYRSSQLALESAFNRITAARGGYFPSLSNTVNYFLSADNLKDLSQNRFLTVGLTLNIPIFSGFATENRVQFAEVLADNRQIELNDLERGIKLELQKVYLDLQASEKALEVSRRSVLASEENRKIENEKYNLGAGTLLNVLIANSEYIIAQTNFLNAQFQFIVLNEQLKHVLGTLDIQ